MVSLLQASPSVATGLGGVVPLPITPSLRVEMTLPARNVTLAELQRHKRQFVSLHKKAIATQGAKGGLDWDEETVARKFVEYLETQLTV